MAKADAGELQEIQLLIARQKQSATETAAGAETLKCLMCGHPRTGVTGAIDDPAIALALGQGMSTRVTSLGGQGNSCFVYGDGGTVFWGRSPDGKPIVSKGKDPDPLLPPLTGLRKAADSTL
jgi:hypothetical protein